MNYLTTNYQKETFFFDNSKLILAYQFFEESRNDRGFNKTSLNRTTEKLDALSFNLDFQKKIKIKSSLSYGVEYIFNNVNSKGKNINIENDVEIETVSRYPDAKYNSFAIYGLLNYDINEKSKIETGIRYNHFIINAIFDTTFYNVLPTTEINNGAFTGNLGYVYKFSNNLL